MGKSDKVGVELGRTVIGFVDKVMDKYATDYESGSGQSSIPGETQDIVQAVEDGGGAGDGNVYKRELLVGGGGKFASDAEVLLVGGDAEMWWQMEYRGPRSPGGYKGSHGTMCNSGWLVRNLLEPQLRCSQKRSLDPCLPAVPPGRPVDWLHGRSVQAPADVVGNLCFRLLKHLCAPD